MPVSQTLFELMLAAYPREFRREYGSHMVQLFRDCHRAETRKKRSFGIGRLWLSVLYDLARTAPREHWDNLGKDNSIMNKLAKDAIALLGCVGIIIVAFLLLSYGRKNEVPAILMFGRALDAVVTAGIVGNLIIFLLVKTTRLSALRIALWVLIIVHAALLLVATIIGSRVDPQFNFGKVLLGYAVSFIFWFSLHWIWAKSKSDGQLAVSGGS